MSPIVTVQQYGEIRDRDDFGEKQTSRFTITFTYEGERYDMCVVGKNVETRRRELTRAFGPPKIKFEAEDFPRPGWGFRAGKFRVVNAGYSIPGKPNF